jgi:hypothetical protein
MQKRCDQREQVARDLLISLRCGVNPVGLHTAGNAVDVFEQKRKQRHMILSGQKSVGFIELANVVRSVVRRKCDAPQHHLYARVLERGNYAVQIPAGTCDGQAAKTIVAAKGDDDENGLESKHIIKPVQAVFGCVAADAGIDDVIVKSFGVEILLQKIRVAIACIGSVAGREAVAECDDDRAVIMRSRYGLCSGSSRGGLSCWFRRWVPAIASTEGQCRSERKKHTGTAGVHHTFNLTVERKPDEGARKVKSA